jgi:hypothetical protein
LDPYREGLINALDWVQNKASKFAHQRNYLKWDTLAQRREIARICAFFKAYTGERAWKTISDRLQKPYYHTIMIGKSGAENKRHVGKYSFVHGTIQLWNNYLQML